MLSPSFSHPNIQVGGYFIFLSFGNVEILASVGNVAPKIPGEVSVGGVLKVAREFQSVALKCSVQGSPPPKFRLVHSNSIRALLNGLQCGIWI